MEIARFRIQIYLQSIEEFLLNTVEFQGFFDEAAAIGFHCLKGG
jgi:hypothetical protein